VRVNRVDGATAWVEDAGQERRISLLGLDDVNAGDYVFEHAGLALERMDAAEAALVLATLEELESMLMWDQE
jgi:hydrogenase assembly chaperone HypC/HupF